MRPGTKHSAARRKHGQFVRMTPVKHIDVVTTKMCGPPDTTSEKQPRKIFFQAAFLWVVLTMGGWFNLPPEWLPLFSVRDPPFPCNLVVI